MRIKLRSTRKFFKEILEKNGLSLRKFGTAIGINYSNLKQYYRGERTLPSLVFKNLLKHSTNKKYWKQNILKLDDNWGKKRGGNISGSKNDIRQRLVYARKFK